MYELTDDNPYRPEKFGNAWDLYIPHSFEIDPGCSVTIPLNIRFNLPPDVFAYIYPRSSTFSVHGLLVPTGVIDSDYTGKVHLQAYNFSRELVCVTRGQRLVQILFHNVTNVNMYQVSEFVRFNARQGAIGSTGV